MAFSSDIITGCKCDSYDEEHILGFDKCSREIVPSNEEPTDKSMGSYMVKDKHFMENIIFNSWGYEYHKSTDMWSRPKDNSKRKLLLGE